MGIPYEPPMRINMALWSLEAGQSPIDVMRRYQVAVVSHGSPAREEIEAFRQQFVRIGILSRNPSLKRGRGRE